MAFNLLQWLENIIRPRKQPIRQGGVGDGAWGPAAPQGLRVIGGATPPLPQVQGGLSLAGTPVQTPLQKLGLTIPLRAIHREYEMAKPTPEEAAARRVGKVEETLLPFLRRGPTGLPFTAITKTAEKLKGRPIVSTPEEIKGRAPTISTLSGLLGDMASIATAYALTGGVGQAVASKLPPALLTVSPFASRAIPLAARQAAAWGIKDLASEATRQIQEGKYQPGTLLKEGLKGTAMGATLAIPGSIGATIPRILAMGGTMSGWTALEKYVQKGTLTAEDLLEVAATGAITSLLEAVGASKTTREYTNKRINDFSREMSIQRIVGRGSTREEAEKVVSLLEALGGTQWQMKATPEIVRQLPAELQEIGKLATQAEKHEAARALVDNLLSQAKGSSLWESFTTMATRSRPAFIKLGAEIGKPKVPAVPKELESVTQSDQDLIARLTGTLREATPMRGKQEELYAKARAQKLAKVMGARERIPGEKGFFAELGALKGELPKVEFESIRQNFDQKSIDRLFDIVRQNKKLDEWEKVPAEKGLFKILGKTGGGVPTKGEIAKLHAVFGEEFTEALLSKRTLFQKLGDIGMQAYNLPRSLMAGVGDFSGTLMQNLMFAYRHPIITAKNFARQVGMFASETFYRASQDEIASRPTYELMKKADVSLTEVGPLVAQREEQFMASIAEKIPGLGKLVRATGRAWTGFLNRMRADVFDQMVDCQKAMGLDVNDAKFLKDAGGFVNAGTGRGSLGKLERVAPVLSQGMFSARKLAATAKFLDPRLYITSSPAVRKEALKTILAFVGGGTTIITLAKLAGAEVGDDPTSTDYGKIKIGNTRFNVWGPYQQVAVLFSRLWKGYATSSTTGKIMTLGEGYKPLTRFDLITRFFESKEHPTLSLIIDALRGETQIGQPFNLSAEVLNRFIPMVLSDAYDLYQEHGPRGLLGGIPAILGIPTQTYGKVEYIEGKGQFGQPTSQVRPIQGIGEMLSEKIFGGQPLGQTTAGSVKSYYQQLRGMPREEAIAKLRDIEKNNPQLFSRLMEEHRWNKAGATAKEREIAGMGVANYARAAAIADELRKLKGRAEQRAYLERLRKLKILTEDVYKQLVELRNRGEL